MLNKNNLKLFHNALENQLECSEHVIRYQVRNISKLQFKQLFYYHKIIEWVEFFYDSEPDYDDEQFNMHMDYVYKKEQIEPSGTSLFYTCLNLEKIQKEKENFHYASKEYSLEKLKKAHDAILEQRKNYENERIEFNNWIEPHFKGNWNLTQKDVEMLGIAKALYLYKNFSADRWFLIKTNETSLLYFYGRDIDTIQCDYSFVFRNRPLYNTTKFFKKRKKRRFLSKD